MVESATSINRVQKLVELERSLTAVIEKAEPWLPGGEARPLPSTMEEVEHVFHLARNLSSRTSAPSGWNPQAPVIGFSTPNPLPHQLRGGALGALQLDMTRKHQQEVKQEQIERKREREEKAKAKEESSRKVARPMRPVAARQGQQQRPQPVMNADMNLSDDSSSSEEEDDDDDDD